MYRGIDALSNETVQAMDHEPKISEAQMTPHMKDNSGKHIMGLINAESDIINVNPIPHRRDNTLEYVLNNV